MVIKEGLMNRPPKLKWDGPHCGDYLIQSEKRIDEPRTFYAMLLSSPRGRTLWQGPTRINRRSAEIDAEYHAALQAALVADRAKAAAPI